MAKQDYESKLEEIELNNLQKAISEVEAAVAVSTPGTRPIFESFLLNARSRVGTLDKKLKESEKERDSRARDQVVMAQMAGTEKALSADEKRTFGGFLDKEFFTKKDFGALESFYAKTWDRLSDGGKNELSHRVWNGVREGEYRFSELPKTIREKETEQAYHLLRQPETKLRGAERIPAEDRQEFIRTYEAGKKEDAGRILDRNSFKEHLFRHSESKGVKRIEANKDHETDGRKVFAASKEPNARNHKAENSPDKGAIGEADFATLEFGAMKVASDAPSVAPQQVASARPSPNIER